MKIEDIFHAALGLGVAVALGGVSLWILSHTVYDVKKVGKVTIARTVSIEQPSKTRRFVWFNHADLECLAQNIYYEASLQPFEGKVGVAYVVLNRVRSPKFPGTVCAVVKQWQKPHRLHGCQFSWYCDGKSDHPDMDNPLEKRAWQRAFRLAATIWRYDDPTRGALYYHAVSKHPNWASSKYMLARIGDHIFYSHALTKDELKIARE